MFVTRESWTVIQTDERNAVEQDLIASSSLPAPRALPSKPILCIAINSKIMPEESERYHFLTIRNDDHDLWLGIGMYYNIHKKELILYVSGVLNIDGRGLGNTIPIRKWHHICVQNDLEEQSISVAINGVAVINNEGYDNLVRAPTEIHVSYFKNHITKSDCIHVRLKGTSHDPINAYVVFG